MLGKWQPIETAPRDGELLLLTDANWPVLYNGKNKAVKVGGFWDGKWNVLGSSWKPTHWMPLPLPPSGGD